MKKLLFAIGLLTAVTSQGASFRSVSFLNPSVATSIMVSNNAGWTNLNTITAQIGPQQATNYAKVTSSAYTNVFPITMAASNNVNTGGILSTQTSVALPGLLVLVTNNAIVAGATGPGANITNSSGIVYAKFVTNDMNNVFQDVTLPDINQLQPLGTSVSSNMIGVIQIVGVADSVFQSTFNANTASNAITAIFAPLVDGVNEDTFALPKDTFVMTFTNASPIYSASLVPSVFLPQVYSAQVSANQFANVRALRLRSITAPNSSAATWITSVTFNGYYP